MESVGNSSAMEMGRVAGERLVPSPRSTQRPVTILPVAGGSERNMSLVFRDGRRSVDFVLVWDANSARAMEPVCIARRKIFEEGLAAEGLQLEHEPQQPNGLVCLKLHAPRDVLRQHAEILKLRMPMREELCSSSKNSRLNPLLLATQFLSQKIPGLRRVGRRTDSVLGHVSRWIRRCASSCRVDTAVLPERRHRFTAVYSKDKEYLFDMTAASFFSSAIRARVVQFVLDRQRFSANMADAFAFGVDRLVADGTYAAAYCLHDGDLHSSGTLRHALRTEWASLRCSFRYQPLDHVKDYFGVKISLYFAWLGFYTHMLLPAAAVGLLCFVYSCLTLSMNQPSQDMCVEGLDVKMCPLCDYWCDYWDLKETCLHAKVTYLFDNPTTVFFAVFMSFWASMFVELWKRYSAEITHRWDLTGLDARDEHPRPEYLARLAHVKRHTVDLVTNTVEPRVPFWRMRLPAVMLSSSAVLLLVALAVAAVLGVVLYRMSVLAALSVQGDDSLITSHAVLFTTATAACINLCCILVFNWMYTSLAYYLTEVELLRTQTEFDDSLTLKIYLLQFVNYYASIFYIAFFKGKYVGSPQRYNRLFGFRQEECGPGGCLMELCIQLAIIMIGKQAMNTALEMLNPLFFKWLNTLRARTGRAKGRGSGKSQPQWLKDFKLVDWGPRGLFPEYLEMVLQYGFVTIFVAAFPLAPLFALVNNVLELRLDATKLLTLYRRPVSQRVRDLGVWLHILDCIGKLSVITNGFIIAFTSTLVPKLVYMAAISPNHSLDGFLNHSLAYFDTRDLEPRARPAATMATNVTLCRYPDYREPPWSEHKYSLTTAYWQILAARLLFVVVFENVVVLVMMGVRWCVPDMSAELRERIRREAFVTGEIILAQEAIRQAARSGRTGDLSPGTAATAATASASAAAAQWGDLSGSELDLAIRHRHEREFCAASANCCAYSAASPNTGGRAV